VVTYLAPGRWVGLGLGNGVPSEWVGETSDARPHDEMPTSQEESRRTPPRLASSYVFHWWEGDFAPGTGFVNPGR
jgi:hypothetical protein